MAQSLVLCDLTQSYSATGGGIRTYLTEKRDFIDRNTPHRHLLIVPGAEDRTTYQGRHITVEIASPLWPGSPNYRFVLRAHAVLKALREFQPASIECQCAYILPLTAIYYRRKARDVALIAGYRTDVPTVYVEPVARRLFGRWAADKFRKLAYVYGGLLYSKFDAVYALNDSMAKRLTALGAGDVKVLPLGIDPDIFHPNRRSEDWRCSIGAGPCDPVLIYAGRIDYEKEADVVVDAFLKLPENMNAHLVMVGEGNLLEALKKRTKANRVHFTGFVKDRGELATLLASSDVYVSAMAHETFGISIIEAQAAGLPVVGVRAGAMTDRVPATLGRLGPVSDAVAMADIIALFWQSGEARATGERARTHVEKLFSWQRTFEHLFGYIYRGATGRDLLGETADPPVITPKPPHTAPQSPPHPAPSGYSPGFHSPVPAAPSAGSVRPTSPAKYRT